MAPAKLEGPLPRLTFLGIELDTKSLMVQLPAGKLTELKVLVASWLGKQFCTRRELESMVGKLQHASKVVMPGRSCLRQMFELMGGARRSQRFIQVNVAF